MNSETETNINQAISWLHQTGGAIQDFATEQAPLYCREVIAWQFFSGILYACIGAVVFVAGLIALRAGVRMFKADPFCPESTPPCIIGFCVTIAGFIMIAVNANGALKAAIAPRLVIVKHLRGLDK